MSSSDRLTTPLPITNTAMFQSLSIVLKHYPPMTAHWLTNGNDCDISCACWKTAIITTATYLFASIVTWRLDAFAARFL